MSFSGLLPGDKKVLSNINKKKKKDNRENLKFKQEKKSDNKARKQGMKDAVAGKNPGKRSRVIGRAEARSYLPDDLRKKPKNRWTARDKARARKAKLSGMHKDTKEVNKKITDNKKRVDRVNKGSKSISGGYWSGGI